MAKKSLEREALRYSVMKLMGSCHATKVKYPTFSSPTKKGYPRANTKFPKYVVPFFIFKKLFQVIVKW